MRPRDGAPAASGLPGWSLRCCPVWPDHSLGGKFFSDVQHWGSDAERHRAGGTPDELRTPDLRPVRSAGGRGTLPRLPAGPRAGPPPPGRAEPAAARGGAARAAAAYPVSPADPLAPSRVRSQRISAAMKSSISPSSTAAVLVVSSPVRTSLMFW